MKRDTQALPSVSVLIPARNAASSIAESIESALRQSHRELEVIVVVDGSTDETDDIVERLARDDARLVLLRNPTSLGVAAARNRALNAAHGALVAPLDADDVWHPDKIARQLRRLDEARSPRTGVVYCWSADIDASGRVIGRRLDLDRYEGDVYAPLVVTNFLGNASVPLIRKDLISAIGGWDTSLRDRRAQGCEDWQLYLRLAERCAFALEPAFLVGYRQTPTAMSRDVGQMRRSYRLVLDEAMAAHPELPAAVFRWSRSAFDQYTAEILREGAGAVPALLFYLNAIVRDPTWLTRKSTRKKVRRWLRRLISASHQTIAPLPPFSAMSPELDVEIGEGPSIVNRRLRLSAIRIQGSQL